MTIWIPDLAPDDRPVYRAIVKALAGDIDAARLLPGTRLPPQRELAHHLGVTVGTISRAYSEAERQGLVQAEVGRGTFVREPLRAGGDFPSQPNSRSASLSKTAAENLSRSMESFDRFARLCERPFTRNIIDLSVAHPVAQLSEEEFSRTLSRLAADPALASLTGYPPAAGFPAHREAGARWIARSGMQTDPARTLLTMGGQHALNISLFSLERRGQALACEAMTYPGVKGLSSLLDMPLQPLAVDRDGLVPEAFEDLCKREKVGALYTVPNLQNPTASILTEKRRIQVAEIAQKYDVAILEDDIFGFLLWNAPDGPGKCPPPIASLVPERSYFMTSLSKSGIPALRVGILQVPPGKTEKVAAYTRLTTSVGPSLFGELARMWIDEGIMDELARSQAKEAQARQTMARHYLGPNMMLPSDGFHFWLNLPEGWTAANFITTAMARGVALSAPDSFTVDPSLPVCGVRVCVQSALDREGLEHGLAILRELLEGGGHMASPVA